MVGILKNQRHELFAQGLATGKTAIHAYEFAGYKPNPQNAGRMTKNDDIQARVKELQKRSAIKAELTVADIVKKLETLEASAIANNQISAGVTAVMGMAKILGLIVDKREQRDVSEFSNMTESELDGVIERLQKEIH
jgi:hypothetical protein